MGLFNSRSAAKSCWLLMSLALQLLLVQAQRNRYISRGHHIRRINHQNSKMQISSSSLLHPISVPLLSGPILKFPPPPKKFAHATFAPIPTAEDPNDPVNGFIQLVLANQPLYPPAPYQKPTDPSTTAVPTTEVPTTVPPPTTVKSKTLKPYRRPVPTTSKLYVRPPPPTTAKPYVRPPPPTTAKPYVRPFTINKAIIPKTIKPSKNPLNTIAKITKATSAPTTSTAAADVVSEIDAIDDIRIVGGEMMKLDATKALEPVTAAVTAPSTISTAAPSVLPPATTEPVPIETEAPEEAVKILTPVPLSFSSFQPYPRPFYRPAIYTRPPFRPHLRYTLLPKSTEAPDTTEPEPEIVTEKEPIPALFDDFEMTKILPDVSDDNSILAIDEVPKLSESPELPPVITEAPIIDEDTEEPVIVEDDLKAIDVIELVQEEPKVLEAIPNEPDIVENTEEPIIIEDDQEVIEVIETVPEEPKILEIIPNEPEILEFIPDELEILENLPQEPIIFDSIPVDLAVEDFLPNEVDYVETIPEIPTVFEDVPKELDVFEPELVEPQTMEEEKLLFVENEEFDFDSNMPEIDEDILISTEKTEAAEVPVVDFEMVRNSEDIAEAILVAAEVPKIIQEESKPDLIAPEIPKVLEVSMGNPVLEDDVIEHSPIIDLPEAQEIATAFESQPFKRSHKYEPVWNIHNFGHGDKYSPPRSQSFPGWPQLSSTTRRSHDYPTWLQSTTSSPIARNIPDWPQDVTTHRGYDFSKWSPKGENDKKSITDSWSSEKPLNTEIKTIESTKKSEENTKLNNLKNIRKSRRRFRTSTTIKPTTRRGTLPTINKSTKSTTLRPLSSSLFPTWDEIQTRKASRERTSSESKESNSGFGTGFDTGFAFGDWGTKI